MGSKQTQVRSVCCALQVPGLSRAKMGQGHGGEGGPPAPRTPGALTGRRQARALPAPWLMEGPQARFLGSERTLQDLCGWLPHPDTVAPLQAPGVETLWEGGLQTCTWPPLSPAELTFTLSLGVSVSLVRMGCSSSGNSTGARVLTRPGGACKRIAWEQSLYSCSQSSKDTSEQDGQGPGRRGRPDRGPLPWRGCR